MRLPINFLRAARNEFDEAADWYEQRQSGRGAKFTAAVRAVLDRITEQPESYAQVLDDVREALVSKYPYCVYYRVEQEQIIVLSVFHTARDPAHWQRRV